MIGGILLAYGIAYQNKDILFKILSKNYKNKSFNIYGLDLPKIKEVLPTNLPTIQVDEKRLDNIFLLEDDTILLLEYESSESYKNLLKYCYYAFRVSEAYFEDKIYKLILVTIYTGDIEQAPNILDLGCIKLQTEQVFLSKFNGNEIYDKLKNKVENNKKLTDADVMQFIILPLTQKENKQDLIENTVNLAKKITDEEKQSFIIAGILTATDKFIDKDYSNNLKEWLKMTKVGRLFEEEKLEYAQKREKEKEKEIARKLLSKGIDILTIMESTSLTKTELLKLKEEISA
jgi:hypothetical protein